MIVTCQECNGTGYKQSASKYGGPGLYRCPICHAAGTITLHPLMVREVLRNVANAYDATIEKVPR